MTCPSPGTGLSDAGAIRKIAPAPGERGYQMQLGIENTSKQAITSWRVRLTMPPGVIVAASGGGATVTEGDADGIYVVKPENGNVAAGARSIVAVRVHTCGITEAPVKVQFEAKLADGAKVKTRCAVAAYRYPDGTSVAATEQLWPGIGKTDRGVNTARKDIDAEGCCSGGGGLGLGGGGGGGAQQHFSIACPHGCRAEWDNDSGGGGGAGGGGGFSVGPSDVDVDGFVAAGESAGEQAQQQHQGAGAAHNKDPFEAIKAEQAALAKRIDQCCPDQGTDDGDAW